MGSRKAVQLASQNRREEEKPEVQGRIAKKRKATRARLLEAAFGVMAKTGIDKAKIKDITDQADVGFGTFYNYFQTKDELATALLDCLIDDYGRRNVIATRGLKRASPALVMPVSMRLFVRDAVQIPIWQWWAMRPDLLVDRMREGFGSFAKRDLRDAISRGIFLVEPKDVDSAWALAVWMLVGGIHEIIIGSRPLKSDVFVVASIMRVMGVAPSLSREVSSTELPIYPPPDINWAFDLDAARWVENADASRIEQHTTGLIKNRK